MTSEWRHLVVSALMPPSAILAMIVILNDPLPIVGFSNFNGRDAFGGVNAGYGSIFHGLAQGEAQ